MESRICKTSISVADAKTSEIAAKAIDFPAACCERLVVFVGGVKTYDGPPSDFPIKLPIQ